MNEAPTGSERRASGTAHRFWTPRWLPERRAARWAYRAALCALFGLALQAAVVTSLLLGGTFSRLLEERTGHLLKLDTGTSFSLWPGLVHLRQLHLELIDSNVHIEIVVPSGRTKIRLLALWSRQFSTSSVVGEHFIVRVRPKFDALPPRREAALPPLEDGKDSGGGAEQVDQLWGVNLAGIEAHFDELWISEVRYRGSARIDGGFELRPLAALEIHPSRVVLEPGRLTYGAEERVFDVTRATVECSFPETPVDDVIRRWAERLSVALDAAGRVRDVGFVAALAPVTAGLSGGEGDLSLVARAEQGRWLGDLKLEYATDTLRYARRDSEGKASASLRAHATEANALIALEARVDSLALMRKGVRLATLSKAEITAALTRRFPFPEPEDARVDVAGLALAGLEALRAFDALPASVKPRGGDILASAAARWHDGALTGYARADLKDLQFGYDDWTFEQSGRIDLKGLSWKGSGSPFRLQHAAVELNKVRLEHPRANVDSWNLALDCDRLRLRPDLGMLRARFVMSSDDAKPALMLMGVTGLPPGIDEFLAMPNLRVSGKLALGAEQQEVIVERAESDTIDVRGRFIRQGGQNHAAVLFKASPLSLGVRVHAGESGFMLFAGKTWLDKELALLPSGDGRSALTAPAVRRSASTEAASLTTKGLDADAPE